jgi:nicotinamidase-related amidase
MQMRHEKILLRDDSLLLVIDYQEKLLKAFQEPAALIESCVKLIKFAQILNLPVLWTEQYPQGLGPTVPQIEQELEGRHPIEKVSFSCFGEPAFVSNLSSFNKRQLIICGIETHICIEQTVLDALKAGYQCHIVLDACGSRKKKDHKAGMRKMEGAGATPACVEMVIYEILARSDSPEFREILKLVK